MHRQSEIFIHPNEYVAEYKRAVTLGLYTDNISIFNSKTNCVVRGHMDMPTCHDEAAIKSYNPLGG
jgi:hypothetical protein